MALVSELASIIADVEGIPEPPVAQIARALRESGLLSSGARGRNAPSASVKDAANLLIAVNSIGADPYHSAPKLVKSFRSLRIFPEKKLGGRIGECDSFASEKEFEFLTRGLSFGEALEAIIERFRGDEIPRFFRTQAIERILGLEPLEEIRQRHTPDPQGIDDSKVEVRKLIDYAINLHFTCTLTFRRPFPGASFRVEFTHGEGTERYAAANFIPDAADVFQVGPDGRLKRRAPVPKGDRSIETAIGFTTLSRIGEALR
jgi:hypothetical protein